MSRCKSILRNFPTRRFISKSASERLSPGEPRPLLSDPFQDDHVKKIRDTHNQFPKPAVISFDLFDTLYTPRKPVAQQYYDIARDEFGIKSISLQQIEKDFPRIHRKLLSQYPNYGKSSNDIANSNEWWSELIVELLNIPHYTKDNQSLKICERFLSHFTTDEAYQVFDDVVPTLRALKDEGVILAASTNSDSRTKAVLQNLGLAQFFDEKHCYLSYDVGYEKPQRQFFDAVATSLFKEQHGNLSGYQSSGKSAFLERCWHVGDSYDKDFIGPIRAGWNGVLVDRHRTSKFFGTPQRQQTQSEACFLSESGQPDIDDDELRLVANNRVALTSLTQLLRIFDFDPAQPSQTGNYNEI